VASGTSAPLRVHSDWLIFAASVLACAAVWTLTPDPDFAAAQHRGAPAVAPGLTANAAAEATVRSGRIPPGGRGAVRRPGLPLALALLAAGALVLWLIADDLARVNRRARGAPSPTEGTEP
jgi:hypothetical protein